uniref:Uncharacterized protein n=1 Tax=Opuntia streptacantha TaxID=393608 RepID=A0A7C8YQI2_OPUST
MSWSQNDLFKGNYIRVPQRSMIYDLPLHFLINLITAFEVLNGNELAGKFIFHQSSFSKATGPNFPNKFVPFTFMYYGTAKIEGCLHWRFETLVGVLGRGNKCGSKVSVAN